MSLVCLAAGDIFVPVTIEENDIIKGILEVLKVIRPHWPVKDIEFKTFTDGITNKLVACQINKNHNNEDNIVLVRIYGNKTDLLIDRNAEIRNIKTLNVLGLAPKIYGVFVNGLAYQYYPGVTLNPDTVVDAKIWPLVAKQMAKMHKVELGDDVKREPMAWDKTEQFLSLLPDPFNSEIKQKRFVSSFGSITRLRIEFERLKSHLTKTESPIVFAHNDLLLGNVIYNQDEGTVSFIDYEYATYNYQAFDIANHFNEFVGLSIDDIDYSRYPDKGFQTAWIQTYLTEFNCGVAPSDEQVEQVYREAQHHCLASHFLWGIWSLVQYEHSSIDFDFVRYAEIRLNRYYELKDKVFKELS
ncbi:ethanolamine kinase [Pectinophora gossypiella]|uniref:ethanolamine kinase n=1 Tax=Pectinophora gossypiella TaxID=13191 RepID=UPI00214E6D76|nr:ethanolamine kinase [Pectinophora gossypiella]